MDTQLVQRTVSGGWPSRVQGDMDQQVNCAIGIPPLLCPSLLFCKPRGLVVLNAPVLYNLQEQQVTDLLVGSAACHPDLLQEHLLARMTPEDANNTWGWGSD